MPWPSPRASSLAVLVLLSLCTGPALGKPKLAVMDIQDQTRSLTAMLLESLTDSLRTQLARSGDFIVIDKSRQAAALKRLVSQQKRESYKACYDSRCQIPLGQALAADSILRTKITRVGSLYLVIAELVDLEKEAVTGAAQAQIAAEPTWGRDDRLLQGVLSAARQLSGAPGSPLPDRQPPPPDPIIPPGGSSLPPADPGTTGAAAELRASESPEELRAREQQARQLRLEQERLALEARRRGELSYSNEAIRRKRITRLAYGWMAVIGGGILGATGLYYMIGKAATARDQANQATDPSSLQTKADEARGNQVSGAVVLGLGAAALAGGLALIFTAPKLVQQPVQVGRLRLDRVPSGGPVGRGLQVRWGGSF